MFLLEFILRRYPESEEELSWIVRDHILLHGDELFRLRRLTFEAARTYLPVIGSRPSKEHMQLIGPPGTCMSDTLSRISESTCPWTYERTSPSALVPYTIGRFEQFVVKYTAHLAVYYAILPPDEQYTNVVLGSLSMQPWINGNLTAHEISRMKTRMYAEIITAVARAAVRTAMGSWPKGRESTGV